MTSVAERVKNVIAEQYAVDETDLKDETHIHDDLYGDSLDDVELVMALEDEFEFEIPDEAANNLRTVGEITQYIQTRVAA